MKIGITLLLTIILNVYSFGQNPFWVQKDKKIIQGINSVDKEKPNEVEKYFIQQRNVQPTKQNLGFGWSKWTATLAGGYTSIQCAFFYYKDTIESYYLTSYLPDHNSLNLKYAEWFRKTFVVGTNGNVSFDFQGDRLTKPLLAYNGELSPDSLSPRISDYMSPLSGLMYGYSGGINNALLANRQNFNAIKDYLSNEEIYILMFAINPASRLTAIEYYKRNSDKFENKEEIDRWIATVFREVPFMHTLMGCIGETWNSKLLVEYYAQIEEQ